MQVNTYPDRDTLMRQLADQLAGELALALDQQPRAVFAVPGGTTPGPIFDHLSGVDLDWSRVDILPGDERWVPEDNPRSNAAQIRARLIQNRAASARLIPLYRPVETPDLAEDQIATDVAELLPLTIALVGMGTDAHTASLFPGATALPRALSSDAPAAMAITAPGAPEPRITLSAAALKSAAHIHVLITGDEKRDVIEAAQTADPLTAPIAALLDQANVHWSA